jgi:outer membrane lipopolysaccharide assembly protein LptE/RlpB
MSNQLQTLLCGAYFAACGFQSAEKTTIPATLKRINPDGGTAMRDSLI